MFFFQKWVYFEQVWYVRLLPQVAEGLMYLHNVMIIFRDMKPENVLIFSTSLEATVWLFFKIPSIFTYYSWCLCLQNDNIFIALPKKGTKFSLNFKRKTLTFLNVSIALISIFEIGFECQVPYICRIYSYLFVKLL